MQKALSRNIYLVGLGVAILGAILLAISIPGGTSTQTATGTQVTPGNGALFGIAIFLFFASGIVVFVALVGALIRMAQLSHWGWFVCLLLFSGITMLLYIFIGPTTSARMQGFQSQQGFQPQQPPPNPQSFQPQQPPPNPYRPG